MSIVDARILTGSSYMAVSL